MYLNHRTGNLVRGVTALLALSFLAAAASSAPMLPNLRPQPAYDLFYVPNFSGLGTFIRFSVMTANDGTGPLEIRGGDSGAGGQEVWQTIYNTDGTRTERLAGMFELHPSHNHTHFEGFAEYRLTAAGSPDINAVSSKTSFCLLDTSKVNRKLPNSPKKPVYTICDTVVQGISVGWGDEYAYNLPGQLLEITSVPTGEYELTIIADPEERLDESNETDNVATLRIYIDKENDSVSVVEEEKPCRGKKCN